MCKWEACENERGLRRRGMREGEGCEEGRDVRRVGV